MKAFFENFFVYLLVYTSLIIFVTIPLKHPTFSLSKDNQPELSSNEINKAPNSVCDSVSFLVENLRTVPPSCIFRLTIDNKLKNAITQIKLDIGTATFTNIQVDNNSGWIISQTLQKDLLLSHSSGFIPIGVNSPLTWNLVGGNNPDQMIISFSYSALGTTGSCSVNQTLCSDASPCKAAYIFQNIGNCGNFQFTNQSTGTAPFTYSWNFGDPGSGVNNISTIQNPIHQFSKCGDFIVCLKLTSLGCTDSICKTLTFFDNVKPIITCPPNLTFQCNTNINPPATGVATATDNCTPTNAIVITSSDVSTGTLPCNATILRTWQAKDACGNISTCVQTIIIRDNTAPTITCPPNQSLQCNTNINPPATGVATSTDNCTPTNAIVITNSDITTGTLPCNGNISRTWQARDDCGNISSCIQTILVHDTIVPIIKCPSNTTVNTNPGACFYTGNLPQPTATDNCDQNLDFICSLLTTGSSILINAQTPFPKGVNNITCFAKDDCGNQSQNCNFTLTVIDNQPPTITCPGNQTVLGTLNAQGICKAIVNNIPPLVTDNCTMTTVNYSLAGATSGQGIADASGINFMQGLTSITYTDTDMGGNTKSCSFTITVNCPQPANCCPPGTVQGPELVINGDFTLGNTGFTAPCFNYIAPSIIANTGNYSVLPGNLVPVANTQWACLDHTTGLPAGQMLIIDGASSICNIAWQQQIPVTQGLQYAFCAFINNLVIPSKNFDDPIVELWINSVIVATINPAELPDQWISINALWIATSGTALLEIRLGATTVVGNDFAVDDISFRSCGGPCANNLVPNPSFESYITCPTNVSPPFTASIWTLPTDGSADYYNSCAIPSTNVSTPSNTFGTQLPHTGAGYAGFILRPSNIYREYLEVPLTAPLVAGKMYQVSFYVSLADQAQWAIDKIGAYLSNGIVGPILGTPVLSLVPQVSNPNGNFITNKTIWTLISGNYMATGGESYLLIGNFYDNLTTIPIQGLGGFYPGSYYYIDDVTVCENCIASSCDSCCAKPATFNALVNQGFTVIKQDCSVTVNAPQFDSCYFFSTPPVVDGGFASQIITNPNGSWTFNFTQSGTHQICVTVFDACQSKQMCTTVKVDCSASYCDSISTWMESLKTIPPACCYRLHINNQAINKFIEIPIDLKTATFSNISVDNINGWIMSQSGPGSIILKHASGFIPVGNFTPISWCILSGSNPDTAIVKPSYLIGHTKVSCDTSFVFFCPPQPDTTCGIFCKADSIILNTGMNHSTGQFYNNGSPDAYWSLIQTPYTNVTVPRPPTVVATPWYWNDQPSSFQPCSKWITLYSNSYYHGGGNFVFTRCFCICKDGAMTQIHLSVLADNAVNFTLCDSSGTNLVGLLSIPSSANPFYLPAHDTVINLILNKGKYCIKASVSNFSGSPMGLNICGSIKGDGLVKEICCEPSSITGVKYVDTACTAIPYNGSQQTLQGWQIVLCNSITGLALDTAITDQSGSYSFGPLLPGVYTVKEINQTGWVPSLPSTGSSSFFLGANQVTQVNFGNCPPEIDSCCKDKKAFILAVINAISISQKDSLCKAKIMIRGLPPCDSILQISWGDNQIDHGPFSNGMYMHTYNQSGSYTITIPVSAFDSNGKSCFDTLLRIPIDIHCQCECGNYSLNLAQNGLTVPVHCNDSIVLGCPSAGYINLNGSFYCAGDSCSTPSITWSFSGGGINLNGNTSAGNILINLPAPLPGGTYTLNLQTFCGMQKCTCKITLIQRSCSTSDTCLSFCNGTSWTQLNTSWIQDMVVYQGKLIAAGSFNTIGNPPVPANNIASWDGTSWSALTGGGLNNIVNDIEVHNGILYAGGEFTQAGNTPVNKIASWNGSTWSDMPQGGINGTITNVDALLSSPWGLVVGGRFNSVGTSPVTANNIARWNPGPGWATFGNGFNGPVFALSHFNGNVIAGGNFDNSPGGFNNLAIWVGYWTKVGGGGAVNVNSTLPTSGDGIHAIATYNGTLIVGGQFPNAVSTTVQNGNNTHHLAQWNGAYWTTLGIGPNPPGSSVNTGNGIYALKVINNELYVGGQFTQMNNQSINLLAKWNGTTWSGIGHPGTGIVRAIELYSPNKNSACNLYVGGEVLFNQWNCSGVSTVNENKKFDISVYPNPAQNNIFIGLKEITAKEIYIEVFDLLGHKVQRIKSNFPSNKTLAISTDDWAAGTYFIKLYSMDNFVVKKIILSK
ncbi:MAG: T9SS type A sorting domain-containing protein [Saprospiraceae bacterium]